MSWDRREISINSNLSKSIEKLSLHSHAGFIYETQGELLDVVLPYIRTGLSRGEKCVYLTDGNSAYKVLEALSAGGIDIIEVLDTGSLTILTKKENCIRHRYFDPDELISFFKESIDSAKKEGFSTLRIICDMKWMLGDNACIEQLMDYESELNIFFSENDCLGICQYNRTQFTPQRINDMMSKHQVVISGGSIELRWS